MSVLRRDVKQALHKNLGEMTAFLTPEIIYNLVLDEGLDRHIPGGFSVLSYPINTTDNYWLCFKAVLLGHPHVLSGERFDYDKSPMKNPQGKIHAVVNPKDRLRLPVLDINDWNWLERTVKGHADKCHFHKTGAHFTSYLGGSATMKWVKWEVTDCVFAAMLNVMGLRFTGKGDVEAVEKEIEETLAAELSIPRSAVEDHILILLMESRLGWRKLDAVTDLASLLANTAPGTQYIVSYCENPTTDFWHTIYAERNATSFKWVDRQYERKNDRERTGDLRGDPATEAVCWEVDGDSALLARLKSKLKVDTLATTHAKHLG